MQDAVATIVSQLDEIGIQYEVADRAHVSVRVPTRLRGDLGVLIAVAERTATIRGFILRAPDRDAAEVYRRALRRNLDGSAWSFAVDDDGDLYLVARIGLDASDLLDEVLGELSVLVDETYEGLMRTGFDVPENAPVGPPPSARD